MAFLLVSIGVLLSGGGFWHAAKRPHSVLAPLVVVFGVGAFGIGSLLFWVPNFFPN